MTNTKTDETAKTQPFQVSMVRRDSIPQQHRLGRTSKFLPLLERLKTMKQDDAVSFSIEKYTQIQSLRKKLSDLGFTITTRSNTVNGVQTITAYIYHTPNEEKKTK